MASDGVTTSTTETSWLYRPAFPETWERHVLYSLATWINGMAFKNINFSATGKPVIKIAEIKNGITDQTKFTDSEYDQRYFVTRGEMLFSWSGQPETSIDAFYWDGPDGWLNQHVFKVLPDNDACTPSFLYYILKYLKPNFIGIARNKQTTGLGHVTKADLEAIQVAIPDRPTQDRITHVLGKLDARLTVNRRMNRTLEKMAAAIFKSWFIDFDPVHAKAEGRDPNLPAEITDLFPDTFEDSDLGPIPKGWNLKPIGDAVRCVGGATPNTKTPEFWEGGRHPFVTPKDMSSLQSPVILDSERHITDAGVEKISSKQLPVGTVILSSRAPIGYLGVAAVPVSVNQGVIAMICDGDLPNLYILHWTAANMDLIKSRAGGTTFAEISKRNFRPIPALVPETRVLEAFMANVGPLHERITLNVYQCRRLAGLRDTLLPKLLSGEIKLPEAEELIEGGT